MTFDCKNEVNNYGWKLWERKTLLDTIYDIFILNHTWSYLLLLSCLQTSPSIAYQQHTSLFFLSPTQISLSLQQIFCQYFWIFFIRMPSTNLSTHLLLVLPPLSRISSFLWNFQPLLFICPLDLILLILHAI